MAGQMGEVNYDAIPAVIYTHPEAAYVGWNEEQLKERQIPYCKGTFPFTGAGRARCMGDTEGFVKVLSHTKTDRILGVHIIGARASDMIPEAVLAMETGASCEDISRVVHGHPTFSEAFQEELGVDRDEVTPDGRFTIEHVRCVGACGLAPVIAVDDSVHGPLEPDDVTDVIEQYSTESDA